MKSNINQQIAIDAIKKKLVGKKLNYREIYSIMDEISHKRLSPVLTTYFAAAGFSEGFNDDELYSLTKAMVETGPRLNFRGIVADKHSVGGVAGTRTTMIVVPIIAASGYKIPKTSSRAITSPAGTADTMEVLSPVEFDAAKITKIVRKVGGCIVWGGHVGLAPADDYIIQVEKPLSFESFDKIIVSVMAKKVASSATHVVIDIPYGPTMKIQHEEDAKLISRKFKLLADRFNIKLVSNISHILENAGSGVGPVLEARDVLSILEQKSNRELKLEERALVLSGKLLDICNKERKIFDGITGQEFAKNILTSGKALLKFKEIVKAQGGDDQVTSEKLKLGEFTHDIKSNKHGKILHINNQEINIICRILGCPSDKKSGMFFWKKLHNNVEKSDILTTLYSTDKWKLKEAIETLKNIPIFEIENI